MAEKRTNCKKKKKKLNEERKWNGKKVGKNVKREYNKKCNEKQIVKDPFGK